MKGRSPGHKPQGRAMLTGKGQGTMPGDSQELWLCPCAPTRLTWPPGGVRQLAVGPQLLTVSRAPIHGLWLCLIEDQGYGRRQPRSRARIVCTVVCGGTWHACTKDVGGKVARMESGLERHPAGGQSGPSSEATRHAWATTWAVHVVCPCVCHNRAQAQVRKHMPEVMDPGTRA